MKGSGLHKIQGRIMPINNPQLVLILILLVLPTRLCSIPPPLHPPPPPHPDLSILPQPRYSQSRRIKKVAQPCRTITDEGEDLGEEGGLGLGGEGGVEFGEAGFAWEGVGGEIGSGSSGMRIGRLTVVVEDQHGLNHLGVWLGMPGRNG